MTATLRPIKVRSFSARPRPRGHLKLRDVWSRHDWGVARRPQSGRDQAQGRVAWARIIDAGG
jgi:hypothetical protein